MQGALSHIRVLDLTRILAGPWCTQNLADLGAEVIKVERPGVGDDTRTWGPPWLADGQGGNLPDSTYFSSANRGKKSITVDIATDAGQQLIRTLAESCDVVVENYKVGDLKRYGLDYESLKKINPALIYCSVTGFGQDGPYSHRPGYDFVFQGMGGLMSITGEKDELPGGGPQKVGIAVADITTGMYATVAVLGALVHRAETGVGQYIDTALLDCIVAFGSNQIAGFFATGKVPQRYGNAHANAVPYGVFATSDGQIILAIANDGQWQKFCRAMNLPELGRDESFLTTPQRLIHRERLIPQVAQALAGRKRDELLVLLEEHGVSCAPINDYSQVFADPQVQARQLKTDIAHPDGHVVSTVTSPIRLSETPVRTDMAPPRLGQHTDEVLGALLGLTPESLVTLREKKII
ncbi:CaiB/BaiF CoA transferase family protein [Polaromonas sp. UC242_47]|uniref:CaiB/BaiF CoA transferase family protein n=1 Tax=Polaromonas sp. UC242_47 TaxID=3374626 RepID=UPI0037977F17